MAPCERSGGINGHQMDRWLGLSPEHHPLFSELTLAQNSEQRLKEALGRLGRARDMTEVFGKGALKDVLGCFEPISALSTPTDKHTGGNTLYAQVAAAYEAYRAGNLDQNAMDAVEAFTEQILFAIAGNTQFPDSSVSSLTYENELLAGSIEKTHYETDALGEQALQTLDHIQTLFTTHRHSLPAQHNDQRQFIQARRALPKKVIGVLTAIELILAGCTGGISPTILPTEVKPAITAPLPTATAEHIPTPTLTLTSMKTPTVLPTEAPTPTAAPMPGKDVPFPSTWETHADPQEAKLAFEELYAKNEDVRADVEKMKPIIRQIGKNQGIDNLVITGYYWRPGTGNVNWALVITDTDGNSYIYQVKTEEGWLNYADAGGYSLLKETDPANIRLIAVHPPENGTLEPDNLNGYTTFVLVDANGQMKAVLNTAEDQWKTGDGLPYKTESNAFTPFEPGKKWSEVCAMNELPDPSEKPLEFDKALEIIHSFDQPLIVYPNPNAQISLAQITINEQTAPQWGGTPSGWKAFEYYQNYASDVTEKKITFCGKMQDLDVWAMQVGGLLNTGEPKLLTILIITSKEATIKSIFDLFGENSDQYKYILEATNQETLVQQLSKMKKYKMDIVYSDNLLATDNIPKEFQSLARVHNSSFKKGYVQEFIHFVSGNATLEEYEDLLKHGYLAAHIFTVVTGK